MRLSSVLSDVLELSVQSRHRKHQHCPFRYCVLLLPRKRRSPRPLSDPLDIVQLPEGAANYLGPYLNSRRTWHKHILARRKHLGMTLTKMYWLLGRKSKLSTGNKVLIYEAILKPLWTYETQVWNTVSTSNIEIIGHL
jgi:hypothetical protein